jgi:hypothetical protein
VVYYQYKLKEEKKMGYNSKIFVVEKTMMYPNEEGKMFAIIIASIEMAVFPDLREVFKKETDCYIYADDGETELTKDMRDDPLKEATIDAVIECLEQFEEKEHYRRTSLLLGLLKGFDVDKDGWRNIAVLHYGH